MGRNYWYAIDRHRGLLFGIKADIESQVSRKGDTLDILIPLVLYPTTIFTVSGARSRQEIRDKEKDGNFVKRSKT